MNEIFDIVVIVVVFRVLFAFLEHGGMGTSAMISDRIDSHSSTCND